MSFSSSESVESPESSSAGDGTGAETGVMAGVGGRGGEVRSPEAGREGAS